MNSLPVANVQLILQKCGLKTTTDSSGNFKLVPSEVLHQNNAVKMKHQLQMKKDDKGHYAQNIYAFLINVKK